MSHVLYVTCHTCHMSQISSWKNLTIDPMCYIFLEIWCKIQFNPPQVTCVICHMSHMSQVAMTPCVIYFWKTGAKSCSIAMLKSHPSHVTHGTCYKYQLMSAKVYIESMYLFCMGYRSSVGKHHKNCKTALRASLPILVILPNLVTLPTPVTLPNLVKLPNIVTLPNLVTLQTLVTLPTLVILLTLFFF